MDDFPGHPFSLYDGERREDMTESIRKNGILLPLILRAIENGRYHILSGHNRKYCGLEAGLDSAAAIVKRDLSEEEAWMYVVETNLMQRSFADMLPSEKAAVLYTQHAKMFSQGKRNDIIRELENLAMPCAANSNATSGQVDHMLKSRDKAGVEYGMDGRTVARYLRIHQLIPELKHRLDGGGLAFIPAVTLSFLYEPEQKLAEACVALNGFRIDMRKADALRDYSERGKLNEESVYLILSGELGAPPKKKRLPTVKVSKAVYARYFTPTQPAREVQEIVEKALELYFTG
jgi:ParB family chromosome partitioning protein